MTQSLIKIENSLTLPFIKPTIFKGPKPGPSVLITGSAHGNERAGSVAIQKINYEFQTGRRKLSRGSLWLAPNLNPHAYATDERYREGDINRYLQPGYEFDGYEGLVRPAIIDLLDEFSRQADPNFPHYGLDLHSFHAPSGVAYPITFSQNGPDHDWARALAFPRIVSGWYEAYLNAEHDDLVAHGLYPADVKAFATCIGKRAHDNGAVALGLECGPHRSPQTFRNAYRAIDATLNYTGLSHWARLIWDGLQPGPGEHVLSPFGSRFGPSPAENIQALQVLFKRSVEEEFHVDVKQDCEKLLPGQLVISGPDREVRVPEADLDWRLLLGKPDPKAGDYVGYLAAKTDTYIDPATVLGQPA